MPSESAGQAIEGAQSLHLHALPGTCEWLSNIPAETLCSACSCSTLPSWGLIKVPLLLPSLLPSRLPMTCCRQGKEAILQSTPDCSVGTVLLKDAAVQDVGAQASRDALGPSSSTPTALKLTLS